jgi:hypothetical protein
VYTAFNAEVRTMNPEIRSHYVARARKFVFMGSKVADMATDDLHAVIGFLLETGGPEVELASQQQAPLGGPASDPPSNDGLLEG